MITPFKGLRGKDSRDEKSQASHSKKGGNKMISSIRRSATTLLAISTRRNLILSSSTFASLAVTAVSPFTSSTIAAPSRYNSNNNKCTDTTLTMSLDTGYLNAQDAADLDAELMSTPGFSLGKLTYFFLCCITYLTH